MARQERAIRTRRAVLEAAAKVFADCGYAAATVADILKVAGTTKGGLYFHFDSKEALARGIIEAQVEQPLPPQDLKIQEWVDQGMLLAYQLPRDPVVHAGAVLSSDPRGREHYGSAWPDLVQRSVRTLSEAKERGEVLGHIVPQQTGELLASAFHGVQLFSQLETGLQDVEHRISALYQHMMPTIATPAVLTRLDLSADRGARLNAQLREAAEEQATAAARAAEETAPVAG
ncbi:ScbR family autoregulator-binding transcription factor [Streptomyces cavernicola]|uniref:ScbR family autoregulator-binding transcription factor n=1 Tax=Streptomyces cavernicola TaxID=3043613 RepID=A0ABT6SLF9_9ACTN|nr:ScbR family autoregulator-binding transcription factor [Streptomyces sp. B-S-A6]MDI3408233.1 ScbR family autoregulator-binding transcription factor [Streptomyces sp. B-S-A6]